MTDIIETDRLVLRRLGPEDVGDIAALANNFEVARWVSRVPYPYSVEDAQMFIDTLPMGDPGVFGVTAEGRLVGCVSITKAFGYWYGQPFWGRGYATEAGRALVAAHFAKSDDTLQASYMLENAGSKGVLTKIGFEPTHLDTNPSRALGRDVEVQHVELTRTRWEALQ
ncbi:GNAT family N-acetyltransferase [Thalassococcus sp. S3]|uniref:GNAT family N-acetyltransferase n=1 Tax=Thalassococcus sp. S3 TaxID=2017482 RepID=UPI00102404A9|nr:GNAT family N-acetyltransferase [Thalassococcus sp. S3]QBF31963.1 hypothetical protein CFI11_12125 [Thalassococcus sp. S3]